MTTWFCPKNKADCDRHITALQKEIADYKVWSAILQADKQKTEKRLSDVYARIDDHYAYMADGLPSMAEMIADGRAQKFEVYQFQRQYTKQTGRVLTTAQPMSGDKTRTLWADVGYNNYRLPRDVFMQIVTKSRIDRFKYASPVSGRGYICNDFAYSLFCEFQMGPWWDVFIGCNLISNPGHRVDMVWFTGEDDLLLLEPQTDQLFPINMAEREIKQVIT